MMRRRLGFTLIELMVVVAVIAIIIVLAAPPFNRMIQMQRLRSVNAQLVTDLQFARAEAVARRDLLRVSFRANASMTCYSLYTAPDNATRCNCLLGAGSACSAGLTEVRTVQIPADLAVTVAPPASGFQAVAFDWRTGAIYKIPTDNSPSPINEFIVETFIDDARKLNTRLNQAGRPMVCTPSPLTMTETPCP